MMRAPSFEAVLAALVIPLVLVALSVVAATVLLGNPMAWWYIWYAIGHDIYTSIAWKFHTH